jgi:hypothetical protein
MNRRIVLISCFLVLVLVCAGCLTTPDRENSATRGEKFAPQAGDSGIFSGGSGYAPTIVPTPAPGYSGDLVTDQKIIRTSQISLEVRNVTATLDPLRGIAAAHGGYLGSLSVNTRYGDRLYAVMTLRVPAREFDPVIAEIKLLGTLKSESLSADDVTEEYVDLKAQRTALANQLVQYNHIMEMAENVSEVLEVQTQIERVQVELDRIDGRLKYLDNRVDYATITVTLQEPEPVGGGEGYSLVSVINEGISGFIAVAAGLVIILISVIPLIIIGIIAYLVYRWWKKRKGPVQKGPGEKEKKNELQPPGQ